MLKAHELWAFGFGHRQIYQPMHRAQSKIGAVAMTWAENTPEAICPNLLAPWPNLFGGWDRLLFYYINMLREYGPNLGVPNGGPTLFV